MALAWQDSLFASDEPPAHRPEPVRLQLDEHSWVDRAPHWLSGHAELFEHLLAHAPWQQRERWMYDRTVIEPRLVAAWSCDEFDRLPTELAAARRDLGLRYGTEFDSVLVNLYRDGRDGVAWHGDTVRKRLDETVVVTIALGERRPFLLRRGTGGPVVHRLPSGEGDLLVMGGRCQHDWQHTIPKQSQAGARMSVTMRHSRPLS